MDRSASQHIYYTRPPPPHMLAAGLTMDLSAPVILKTLKSSSVLPGNTILLDFSFVCDVRNTRIDTYVEGKWSNYVLLKEQKCDL